MVIRRIIIIVLTHLLWSCCIAGQSRCISLVHTICQPGSYNDSIDRPARVGKDVWPIPYVDDEPPIRESMDEKDRNHMWEADDDVRFNFSDLDLCVVDGECIGPREIGVDCYALERMHDTLSSFRVNGLGYQDKSMEVKLDDEGEPLPAFWEGERVRYIFRYHSTKGKLHLVSLEDVRKEFCPRVKGKCVFMINKFFILKHQELYRLDRDFILRVETEESRLLFPDLKPPFTIVRIFTRTHHNWHCVPRY